MEIKLKEKYDNTNIAKTTIISKDVYGICVLYVKCSKILLDLTELEKSNTAFAFRSLLLPYFLDKLNSVKYFNL